MSKPVIGLTGPTGAGKSTVASALKRLGCAVVDADRIARTVTEQPACLNQLKAAFGTGLMQTDGTLNRKELAQRAFANPENTAQLNRITHPAILAEARREIAAAQQSSCRAVILDAALLFESGAENLCDTTVAVLTSPQARLKRIMARDGISEDLARERMRAQNANDYYTSRADRTFDGGTDWSIFDEKIRELLEKILRQPNEKV